MCHISRNLAQDLVCHPWVNHGLASQQATVPSPMNPYIWQSSWGGQQDRQANRKRFREYRKHAVLLHAVKQLGYHFITCHVIGGGGNCFMSLTCNLITCTFWEKQRPLTQPDTEKIKYPRVSFQRAHSSVGLTEQQTSASWEHHCWGG